MSHEGIKSYEDLVKDTPEARFTGPVVEQALRAKLDQHPGGIDFFTDNPAVQNILDQIRAETDACFTTINVAKWLETLRRKSGEPETQIQVLIPEEFASSPTSNGGHMRGRPDNADGESPYWAHND